MIDQVNSEMACMRFEPQLSPRIQLFDLSVLRSERCAELWTFQHVRVAERVSQQKYWASWDYVSWNRKASYLWIMSYLEARTGLKLTYPPAWCWHSCGGVWGRPPNAGDACMLYGWVDDPNDGWAANEAQERRQTVAIRLKVPHKLALLSSYYWWNELMDVARGYNPDFQDVARSDDPSFVSMAWMPIDACSNSLGRNRSGMICKR